MIVQLLIIHRFTFFPKKVKLLKNTCTYRRVCIALARKCVLGFTYILQENSEGAFWPAQHMHSFLEKYTHTHTTHIHINVKAISPFTDICIPTCKCQCDHGKHSHKRCMSYASSRRPVLEATCPLRAFLRPIQAILNVH